MIEPFYQDERCQLFLGDALTVMGQLEAGSVQAVIADPPYGIDYAPRYGRRKLPNGLWMQPQVMPGVIGDKQDFDPTPFVAFPLVILWGANHYAHKLPHRGRWLVWDKRCQIVPSRNQSDCEIAWCSKVGADRIFYHLWDGMVKASEQGEKRLHPTQKPVRVMQWCLSFAPDAETILDPFMGSGSTGVAAMIEGRKFIGIEISEEYCAIARSRIQRAQGKPVPMPPRINRSERDLPLFRDYETI